MVLWKSNSITWLPMINLYSVRFFEHAFHILKWENEMTNSLIYKATYLTEAKGQVVLTFKDGKQLVGTSRGIFEDETDDGEVVGHVMLFDSKQLEFPIFVSDDDLVSVDLVN